MANYYATARSNYFRVKNREEFLEWAGNVPDLRVWEKDDTFAMAPDTGDCNGWNEEYSDDGETYRNFFNELADHLADNEVAVLVEAGAEKLRYVNGFAIAISRDDTGPRFLWINLSDIYQRVKEEWGIVPAFAEY